MTVTITDDFDLTKIADSGQAFRVVSAGDGWRFVTGHRLLHMTQKSAHRYEVDCSRWTWDHFWHSYFDLDRNYAAIRAEIPPEDAYLCGAALAGQGIRILRQDPWETLVTFIISQRKSIPAIRSCVETLCDSLGTPLAEEQGRLLYSFPAAQALCDASAQTLRSCALGYRLPYVQAAARAVASGTLDLNRLADLPDEELLDSLMQVYGVGVKVANCVALFAYGRVSCAPVDVWIARVVEEHYGGKNPFPRYGNAGILQQYMFYEARTHKTSH